MQEVEGGGLPPGYPAGILFATPFPPRAELRRRLPRLMAGLLCCGVGIALTVLADLGLGPWDVLHQGISHRADVPIGRVGIAVGVVALVGWVPLRERIGIGTVLNVIVIGLVIDWVLALVDPPDLLALRWAALLGGVFLVGVGSGLYIGAGLGAGPRDGLMTGLAARGHSVRLVRTSLEVAVLVGGWLLGGTVGVGTVVFAFGIGPLVHHFLGWLTLPAPVLTAPAQ